ncbi:MAG: PAS domain S-box protein [Verrucomicrobiales bacterium]|nr:PAS domain S-box protein [Verrucomicrobiales bacterium]
MSWFPSILCLCLTWTVALGVAVAAVGAAPDTPTPSEEARAISAAPQVAVPPQSAYPLLTNIAAVLDLDEALARNGWPVDVQGVVTFYDPKWDTLFIQNDTAGIYIFPGKDPRPRFKPGQLLRVRGRTFGTKPLNAISEERVEAIGTAPIPPPIVLSEDDLLTGQFDSRWIRFDATVREWAVRYQRLEVYLSVRGTRVFADSPRTTPSVPPPQFVHSRVRVLGVASKTKDSAGNPTGIRVFVPDLEHYKILEPAPPDPFSVPRVPIPELMTAARQESLDRRTLVRGTVIHAQADDVLLQESTASVLIRVSRPQAIDDPEGFTDLRSAPPPLVVGGMAEAVGYISPMSPWPRLQEAVVRSATRLESDVAEVPRRVSAADIRDGNPAYLLVETEAEFREELSSENLGSLVVHRWRLDELGESFEAALPETHDATHSVRQGTRVRIRGFVEPRPSASKGPGGFRLRIRTMDDIEVKAGAPRWLTREAIRILSFSTIVILAILGWALLLWREGVHQRALNRQLEARIHARTAELTEANRHLEEKVADQRRVEAALLESEARTRAILAHSPDGIVVLDPGTTSFVEVNEAAAALFAVPRGELIHKTPFDLSPPRQPDGTSSKEAMLDHVRSTLSRGSHRFEWVHRDADGRDFPCEVNFALLPREGRLFVIGTLADITARQRAGRIRKAIYEISEAANNAEDLPALYIRIHAVIRQLMNADNLYIASYDPTANLLSFPYYVDEKDPTPPTRPLGRGFTEYVLRTGRPLLADRSTHAELFHRGDCIPVGSPSALWLGVPLAIRGRPFGVLAVQEYHNPEAFGSEEKDVLGFVAEQIAIAIDRRRTVDELRASEARLRESEERFSKAFHNCQGALAIVSLEDGRYLDVNEGFVRTYGYSRAEALGRTSLDLDLWQDTAHRDRLFERLRADGSFRNEETVMRRRDGQILTTVESADVIEIGGRPCVIVFALDITDRKRAETELFHALRKERELSQLKTSFVSLVSHEFRTPLEIILSSGEILERYHDRLGLEQRTRQLRAITASVRRMAHMMNEVLLLGRFDAGRMEFHPAPIDLAAFCERIADDIAAATDHRCPIHLDLGGDLAEAAGDEALLGHIFTNLLSNAVKYSPPSSPVHFRLRRIDGEAVFRVEDRGLGIPLADRERLFSAFHRGSNVGQAPGSGLGLVIVRRCTDLHQGVLSWDSVEGTGTWFEVRIPLWTSASARTLSLST